MGRPAVDPSGLPSSDPPPPGSPPAPAPILCACFRLTAASIRKVIDDHRCTTVDDVSAATGACRGCQTCRPDIEALLAEAAARKSAGA